jgi:glycosyltransferase involved in cell wall biosynthesis
MRVLFVASNIACPGTNGGSTHVTEVVTRLRRTDDVLLIARQGSTLAGTLAIGSPVPRAGFRQPAALLLLRRAWPSVRDFRPDVVYDRGSSFGLGSALGRLTGAPVVYMVLDTHQTRFALATAARIITTLPPLVPDRYAEKVTQVHWGAATDRFHPDIDGQPIRHQLGIASDRIVVCYTGGFYRWHGLELLVSAAARLRALPLTFLLVGAGQRLDAIRHDVQREGLDDRFVFTGAIAYDQVPAYVAAADICAAPYQPALSSGFKRHGQFTYEPLKVFEYLAAGKATITIDCDSDSAGMPTSPGCGRSSRRFSGEPWCRPPDRPARATGRCRA